MLRQFLTGVLLLLLFETAVAVTMDLQVPQRENPRSSQTLEQEQSVIRGQGRVTALTAATVRIDGRMYLFTPSQVKVMSSSYPPREIELKQGMLIEFVASEQRSGLAKIRSVRVLKVR